MSSGQVGYTKQQCHEKSSLCTTRIEFQKSFQGYYKRSWRKGWLDDVCSHMLINPRGLYSEKDCLEKALLCNGRHEFEKRFKSYYSKSWRMNWLDKICSHMETKRVLWTKDQCKEKAILCETRWDFQKQYSKQYSKAIREGWVNDICDHMKEQYTGWSKSDFASSCELPSKSGKGIVYLIKCYNHYENFYKIGLTSLTVYNRFNGILGKNENHIYNYSVMWSLDLPPVAAWELELDLKGKIKPYKYIPKIWFSGVTECFRCHGNCAVLKVPSV